MSVVRSIFDAMGSVQGEPEQYLRPLTPTDMPAVLEIESLVYQFPWSEQIFLDCIRVGYSCWAYIKNGEQVGYAILSVAVGEAHLLNICVHPKHQGEGIGRQFMEELFMVARELGGESLFLEVRPSNDHAVQLYRDLGFIQIGQRHNYYPSPDGREDAWVFSRAITDK